MNREDFNLLKQDLIYFDSAATTLKPNVVVNAMLDYYNDYSANINRSDYQMSFKVSDKYEATRASVKEFINAKRSDEIIFTSGTTDSLNKIMFGYLMDYLNDGDEVITTLSEHAALILPLFEIAKKKDILISYAPLNDQYELTIDSIKNSITSKTKAICLAHITNVIGDIRPIKEIVAYAHEHNILVILDSAQSISHIKTDVIDLDVDFMAFSAHKMMGPTGVGILYGKYELLNKVKPMTFGGGMNASYNLNGEVIYKNLPERLEAGTPNISGVIAFREAINYINEITMEKITNHEIMLKQYLVDKLKTLPGMTIYNEHSKSGIVTFNYQNIFAEDLAVYLDKHNICLRAGSHCSKMIKNIININNTCRISLYLYNTKEEIDKLIEVLSSKTLREEIIM